MPTGYLEIPKLSYKHVRDILSQGLTLNYSKAGLPRGATTLS